jgi:hypothetical protein
MRRGRQLVGSGAAPSGLETWGAAGGAHYEERCAANWRDRHQLYLSFLDALGREEQAARPLKLDAAMLGAQEGDQS